MDDVVINTGYKPRQFQAVVHRSLKRFNILVCHRRFGKTILAVNETIDQAVRCDLLNPRYAYIAPLYSQAKRVAWDYFKYYTREFPDVKVNEAELRIDIPRPAREDSIRIQLLGAENPASLKGIYLDGAVLDEYAEMVPSTFTEAVRPALSDRKGWALFIGTPKGRNHFYELYSKAETDGRDNPNSEWFTALYKASETKVVAEEELIAARMVMSEDEYNQEYEVSFSAGVTGAYYSRQISEAEKNNRFTTVPHQPQIQVDTYWDLGIGDSTAIWFVQTVGKEHQIIDYFEESGLGVPEIIKRLREKPYNYGRAVLPHDASARELGTGKTRVETFRTAGLTRIEVLKKHGLDDGINAVRIVFPSCWFDAKKCARGIEALKSYQRKWEEKNQSFSSTPIHNWCSHGSDAFRYFALGVREERGSKILPRAAECNYNPFGGR